EAGRVQPSQQLAHAGQQRDAVPGGGLVEVLLADAQLVDGGGVEAVAEEVANDLGVAAAEGGGEVGPREIVAQVATQLDPGAEVQFGGIDEGAVNVPDDG